MSRLPTLCIYIESRTSVDFMICSIREAHMGIIATIAHLKHLVLIKILISSKEGVIKTILTFVKFACLQRE